MSTPTGRRPLYQLSDVRPDNVAVDDLTRRLTWAELESRSNAFGHGVEALGAAPGRHVAVSVGNRVEFVEAVLGAWRAGCAYTPMKTGWTAAEVGQVLDDAGTKVVVTDQPGAREAARERGVAVVDVDEGYESWLTGFTDAPLAGERFGYKMAFTSGTTGRPKGVVLAGSGVTPFDAAWEGTAFWARQLQLMGEGTHLFLSRLFNGAPQTFGFGALALGATLRILPRWSPQAALDELADPAVTSTIMVPTMFRQLLALPDIDRSTSPAPGLRTLVHGGEPCPVPVKNAIADWFGDCLVEYYGFTEGGFTVVGPGEWRERPGTVGRALSNAAIHILNEHGDDLGTNREGTVYFELASGRRFHYSTDSATTEEAHRGDAFTVGDVGWLDDDGYLYISGRRADLIVTAGVNVYPAEIEQALADVPGVTDLCVVGGPDVERGEAIVLFITVTPGNSVDSVCAALAETAAKRLASYKQPRAIRVVDDIPRDPTGKLLRRRVRDELWAGREQFAATTAARPANRRAPQPSDYQSGTE
jgi:long-chain acyl-CoA synthetase